MRSVVLSANAMHSVNNTKEECVNKVANSRFTWNMNMFSSRRLDLN